MKTNKQNFLSLSIVSLLLTAFLSASAQDEKPEIGVTNSMKIEKPFDAIEVGSSFRVFLIQGTEQKIEAETPETLNMKNLFSVDDNTLSFNMKGIQRPDKLKIYVTFVNLTRLETSGASNVKGLAPIKAEHFNLEASGASKVEMNINSNNLTTEASGAADVKLSGKADLFNLVATGASNVKAFELAAAKASVEVSGASNVRLNVTDEISGETSGAAKLALKQKPASINVEPSGASKIYIDEKMIENKVGQDESQTIKMNENKTITIDENGIVIKSDSGTSEPLIINDDGVKLILNEKMVNGKTQSKVLVINDDGVKVVEKDDDKEHNFSWHKKDKFNGHWAGFDLGINGYVDKDFNTNLPREYEFLDLRMEKSINVKINFFEQNINLISNHFGMVTGLGLEYANYRFNNKVVLDQDSINLYGYYANDPSKSYTKSKLVVNYLNLPVIFEYQTNGKDNSSSFHISAGMIMGWRIGSHTKNTINDSKIKQRDDFSMNTFKYDVVAKIGWGMLNLNATYSLNTLFKEGRGPELYPFSMGLTLVNL